MRAKASDLKGAYENFDPTETLGPYSHFYVERENSPLHRIKTALLSKAQSPKILFSGHRGSGKSTELNRLLMYPEISEKYFIVDYSAGKSFNPASTHCTDLLVSIGIQIFDKARSYSKLAQEERLVDQLNRLIGAKEIEESVENSKQIGATVSAKVMRGEMKKKLTSKENIHKAIEARLPEIIRTVNTIIQRAMEELGKKVLVVIDDLDKITDIEVAQRLFYEHQTAITQPSCAIIYTVPIAAYYSPNARQMMQAFIDGGVLPNIAITKNGVKRDPDEHGYRTMKQFVGKRMLLVLIEQDALDHAISISGGVFREMTRTIRVSIQNAIDRGAKKVQRCDVEKVEVGTRNDFDRMLKPEDYNELKSVYETQHFTRSEVRAKFLHGLSVLEYANPDIWYDIHPVIVSLLEERRLI